MTASILVSLLLIALWPAAGRCELADIVISHAKVISPPDTVIEDATVIITRGKITYVGPVKRQIQGRHSIDAHGRVVIPGLIDTHVHLNIEPIASRAMYDRWMATDSGQLLQKYLRRGFTTIMSLGDYWPGVLQLREKIEQGKIPGPRLLVAGPLITPPYGHAAAFSPPCAKIAFCRQSGWYREIATEAQARALIDDIASRGANAVKIANEPTRSPDGKPVGFAPGVLHTLIETAHRHGLRVYVHPASVAYAVEAIQAGADVMAHGPGIEFFTPGETPTGDALEPLIKIGAARNIPISTTMVGPLGQVDAKTANAVRQDAKHLFDAGIVLGFGTDSIGNDLNTSQAFAALAESGLSPMQVLQVATLNAARELGLQKEIGTLEVGKRADVVMVAGDPLKTIQALDRIDLVITNGRIAFDDHAGSASSND
ncbi:MAG TPA: amidohydrolase family protein [Steroidobacteraceae bacterium]